MSCLFVMLCKGGDIRMKTEEQIIKFLLNIEGFHKEEIKYLSYMKYELSIRFKTEKRLFIAGGNHVNGKYFPYHIRHGVL